MTPTLRTFSALVTALGLAIVAPHSMAAETFSVITDAQLHDVRAGDSISQVRKAWGPSRNIAHWFDGSRSMVYELTTPYAETQLVYVDLDTHDQVTTIKVVRRD